MLFDTFFSSDEADGNNQSSVEDVTNRTNISSYNEVLGNVVVSNRPESSYTHNLNVCNDHNILVIGVAYSDSFNQWVDLDSPTAVYFIFDVGHDVFTKGNITYVTNVTRFINRDGDFYGDNALRGFLRCKTVDCNYEGCAIHSLHICEYNLRYAPLLSPQEMNINCNNRNFVRRME